jgi:hypothetical protein
MNQAESTNAKIESTVEGPPGGTKERSGRPELT